MKKNVRIYTSLPPRLKEHCSRGNKKKVMVIGRGGVSNFLLVEIICHRGRLLKTPKIKIKTYNLRAS